MKADTATGSAAGTSKAEAPSSAGCEYDFSILGYPQSVIRSISRACELAREDEEREAAWRRGIARMTKLAFHEFCRQLVKTRGEYSLPEGAWVPEDTDIIDTPGFGPMRADEIAAYLRMPPEAFRWAYACWQHHLRVADLN